MQMVYKMKNRVGTICHENTLQDEAGYLLTAENQT